MWKFSIDNQARNGEDISDLDEKAREYLESGKTVRITYKQEWTTWSWRSGTKYLIQSIEPIEQED